MANVIPVKATFTSSTVTGLAEFQSGDTIDISTYLSASSITFAGDSGSDSASLGETLTISGTSNEIETAVTSNTVTIGLPDDVTIGNNLTVTGNLTVQGTTTTVDSTTINVTSSFTFEGATSDDYETVLTVTDPTADRTITLPNATGTVSLLDNTETLSNKTIASPTITGSLQLGDSVKAQFGTSQDLEIYHDGSHSYIRDAGTGNLLIRGDNLLLQRGDGTQTYIQCLTGGAVDLRHANSVKLATTSSGISVTGTAVMGSGGVQFSDGTTQTSAGASAAFAIAQAVALG